MFLNVFGADVDISDETASESALLKGLQLDGLGEDADDRVPIACTPSAFRTWAAGVSSCEQTPSALFKILKVADFLEADLAPWAAAFWAAAASSPSHSVEAHHLCDACHLGFSDAVYSHHPTVASSNTSLTSKVAVLPPRAHGAAVELSLVPSGEQRVLPVDAADAALCATLVKLFNGGDVMPPRVALRLSFKLAGGARDADAAITSLAPHTKALYHKFRPVLPRASPSAASAAAAHISATRASLEEYTFDARNGAGFIAYKSNAAATHLGALAQATMLQRLMLVGVSIGRSEAPSLGGALRALPQLHTLGFSNCAFGSADAWAPLADADELTALTFSHSEFSRSSGGVGAALAAAAQAGALREVTLHGVGAQADALAQPLAALAPSLLRLDLSGNPLGDAGFVELAPRLARLSNLAFLSLADTGLTQAATNDLAFLPALESLDVSDNLLRSEGTAALAAAPPTVSLDISRTGLRAAGARALATHAERLADLRTFAAAHAALGAAGAASMAVALSHTPHLETLDLTASLQASGSTAALVPALASIPALRALHLSYNAAGADGAAALAPHLAGLSCLTLLEFAHNELGADGAAVLAPALAACTALVHVDFNWNKILDGGAIALAQHIPALQQLRRLSLGCCGIANAGGAALAAALRSLPALQDVSVQGNLMGAVTGAQLAQAVGAASLGAKLKIPSLL